MIVDYGTLKTAVTQEINREDLDVKVSLFVQLAERALIRDLQVGTGQEINVDYQEAIEPLVGGDDSAVNWLIERHPDVYFYASLLHSAPYLDDDQRIPVWAGIYGQIRDSINSDARKYSIDSELQLQHSYSVYEGRR